MIWFCKAESEIVADDTHLSRDKFSKIILEYADFFTCKTSYGNMLLSADFLSITLFPPGSDVTLPVRQVLKLSCRPGFLRNLTGLLPSYLPSDLGICLKDGVRVGSAGAFGVFSSRTSPLDTLPQGSGPHSSQTPRLDGSSGIFIVIVEGALVSDPALQTGLQGLCGFLLALGPPPSSWSGSPMPMVLAWFPSWYCQGTVTPQGP